MSICPQFHEDTQLKSRVENLDSGTQNEIVATAQTNDARQRVSICLDLAIFRVEAGESVNYQQEKKSSIH